MPIKAPDTASASASSVGPPRPSHRAGRDRGRGSTVVAEAGPGHDPDPPAPEQVDPSTGSSATFHPQFSCVRSDGLLAAGRGSHVQSAYAPGRPRNPEPPVSAFGPMRDMGTAPRDPEGGGEGTPR